MQPIQVIKIQADQKVLGSVHYYSAGVTKQYLGRVGVGVVC